jgi:hypothetical protein
MVRGEGVDGGVEGVFQAIGQGLDLVQSVSIVFVVTGMVAGMVDHGEATPRSGGIVGIILWLDWGHNEVHNAGQKYERRADYQASSPFAMTQPPREELFMSQPSIPNPNTNSNPRSEIVRQIRESLGLPPVPEGKPTIPVEGHVCEFPFWSFSKKLSTVKELHIHYDDGSSLMVDAPKGMPGPRFPGYLDVILFHGQHELFREGEIHTRISIYKILQELGMDPHHGGNYERFRQDFERAFAMFLRTDRFRDPATGERSHVVYFRIFWAMYVAKNRRTESLFQFDHVLLTSLRSGYMKRLDWEFCLWLDRRQEALARFFYGHILKRVGEKSLYPRNFLGFLRDCGLGYIADMEPRRRNEQVKETVFPALDLIKGHAIRSYEIDDRGNIFFLPKD